MNIAKNLFRYIVGGIPEKQESVYTLQHFPGYVNEDLAVFTPFQNIKAKAEPDFIVDFLGVRTRSTSLANCQREFSGKLLGIPVPGDYHAEFFFLYWRCDVWQSVPYHCTCFTKVLRANCAATRRIH